MKKKIFTILFALSLIFVLCLVVSADDPAEWTISNDGKTLILEDSSYELYEGEFFPSDKFNPETCFIYETYFYLNTLKRNFDSLDILYVSGDYYVNDSGKAALESFVDGNYSSYKISNYMFGYYVNTSKSWIDSLDGGQIESFDVRVLDNHNVYYVLGYDKTTTICHTVGAIYDIEGSYYFINHDKLSNEYFDADGNFSYRKGTVNAYKLNTVQESDMDGFDLNKVSYKSEFERDKSSESGFGKGFFVAVFIIVTVIFGYAIPLVPAVIGAIRITKGKTKNPKRWYLILILCALWILLATLILFAMIF